MHLRNSFFSILGGRFLFAAFFLSWGQLVNGFKMHCWYYSGCSTRNHEPPYSSLSVCLPVCLSVCLSVCASSWLTLVRAAPSESFNLQMTEESALLFYFLLSFQKVDTPSQQHSPQVTKLASLLSMMYTLLPSFCALKICLFFCSSWL